MPWVRQRRKSSAGYGDWQYEFWLDEPSKEDLKSHAHELVDAYDSYSEHFRGYDIELCKPKDVPPIEIERRIVRARRTIEEEQRVLESLRTLYRR